MFNSSNAHSYDYFSEASANEQHLSNSNGVYDLFDRVEGKERRNVGFKKVARWTAILATPLLVMFLYAVLTGLMSLTAYHDTANPLEAVSQEAQYHQESREEIQSTRESILNRVNDMKRGN